MASRRLATTGLAAGGELRLAGSGCASFCQFASGPARRRRRSSSRSVGQKAVHSAGMSVVSVSTSPTLPPSALPSFASGGLSPAVRPRGAPPPRLPPATDFGPGLLFLSSSSFALHSRTAWMSSSASSDVVTFLVPRNPPRRISCIFTQSSKESTFPIGLCEWGHPSTLQPMFEACAQHM